MPDYYDHHSYFGGRQFFYLFFIYFLGSQLIKDTKNNYFYLFIGLFSLFSLFYWYDIGAYINTIIFFTIIYMLFQRQFNNLLILSLSTFITWIFFFLITDNTILNEFLFQSKLIYSREVSFFLGLEFKKPFSAESGRWTKAIMLIFFSSLMLINFNFSKENKEGKKVKIFINLIFISSILLFYSALVRSDSYHLKYTAGLYTFVFIFLTLFYFFNYLKKIKIENKKKINLNLKKFSIISFITLTFLYLFNFNLSKIVKYDFQINLNNFKENVNTLLKAKDEEFMNDKILNLVRYYEEISRFDNCVQVLTDDAALSYLLKKKSCTQFFGPAIVLSNDVQDKFTAQLKESYPDIILFESENKIITNHLNMPRVIQYVNDKYEYFSNFNGYIFYKLKRGTS